MLCVLLIKYVLCTPEVLRCLSSLFICLWLWWQVRDFWRSVDRWKYWNIGKNNDLSVCQCKWIYNHALFVFYFDFIDKSNAIMHRKLFSLLCISVCSNINVCLSVRFCQVPFRCVRANRMRSWQPTQRSTYLHKHVSTIDMIHDILHKFIDSYMLTSKNSRTTYAPSMITLSVWEFAF